MVVWNHETRDSGEREKRGEPIFGVAPSIPQTVKAHLCLLNYVLRSIENEFLNSVHAEARDAVLEKTVGQPQRSTDS